MEISTMTSQLDGQTISQHLVIRIPTADSEPTEDTIVKEEASTLEVSLTRHYLEQLNRKGTNSGPAINQSSESSASEETDIHKSVNNRDDTDVEVEVQQQRKKLTRRPGRRKCQRQNQPTAGKKYDSLQNISQQQLSKSSNFLKARPATASGLLLSNYDPSSIAPAPGYFLLAPRLGERGLLEWRRRMGLLRRSTKTGGGLRVTSQQWETERGLCHLELGVTGECFQPRIVLSPTELAAARRERHGQGPEQGQEDTTRMATPRPATAGHKQPPPHPRRIQQQQPNGHPTTNRKLQLRTLNSHPPTSRPRFSPYTPPLSSSIPISSKTRSRHATVSTDADITDPRIYPTELSSSRDQQLAHAAAMSRSYDCAFFSAGAAGRGHGRRGEFIIHPEWLSESVSIERLRINEKPLIMPTGSQAQVQQQKQPSLQQHQQCQPARSNWPKRCRSAPPPPLTPQNQHQSSINPITWQ